MTVKSPVDTSKKAIQEQFRRTIDEQLSITSRAIQKIQTRAVKDLQSILQETFQLKSQLETQISESEKIDFTALQNLDQTIITAIDAKSVEVSISKRGQDYQVLSLTADNELQCLLTAFQGLVNQLYVKGFWIPFPSLLNTVHDMSNEWQRKGWSASLKRSKEVLESSKELQKEELSIDWRDAVLSVIGIRFPTSEELLELKQKLDSKKTSYSLNWISKRKFLETGFWFEKDLDEEVSRVLKEFLFSIYKQADTSICYEKLLIALCRDQDPTVGLSRALFLLLGNDCIL